MDKHKRDTGSQTNASEAMDDITLPSKPSNEQKVDAGVKETFPASDPVSVATQREPTKQPPQRVKRSPDWMFDKK
jgi:hypothetical protein